MELLHRFKPCNLAITTLFGLLTSSSLWAADTTQQNEDEWKFTLKNAYINRDFDNDALKDTGSWSQAASLFYKSKMHDTPLIIADKPITIGADASVQYAVRLSSDKHVADTVLPFNKETQSQASDFLKYGATLKLGYDKTLLSVGELWLDLPVTAVDASRQLLASYWGTNLSRKFQISFMQKLVEWKKSRHAMKRTLKSFLSLQME